MVVSLAAFCRFLQLYTILQFVSCHTCMAVCLSLEIHLESTQADLLYMYFVLFLTVDESAFLGYNCDTSTLTIGYSAIMM